MTVAVGAAMVLLTVLGIVSYQRSLDRPGGRDGLGAVGDVFGQLAGILDPQAGRARDFLKEQEAAGPVVPSPEDGDDPVRLVTRPDGTPYAVRVRRPGPRRPDM